MIYYAPGVGPDDEINVTFHVMKNGKPVSKDVKIKRDTFIEYNQKGIALGYTKAAQLYALIVEAKAYISITDLSNAN